jgi:hypothetical protein
LVGVVAWSGGRGSGEWKVESGKRGFVRCFSLTGAVGVFIINLSCYFERKLKEVAKTNRATLSSKPRAVTA